MTDNFKEIGSLFGREGAGVGFAKQTDKESFTYAFAWPEGDTWATLTGYLNLDEQPEEYVRRVLQDGGFRSDWGNPDYDPIGDFKETAGDEYRIPLLKVLLREQLESRYEVANHFSTMNRARVELSAFIQNEGGAPLPEDALGTPEEQGIRAMLIATGELPREVTLLPDKNGSTLKPLQALVGGNIETFDIAFGEGVSLYVNEEGLFTCPPNRAIFATEEMAKAGYLSQLDYSKVVEMGDFYTVLNGDIVAVGFDPETGESRSLTDGETACVEGYFTVISRPGSGAKAVDDIRTVSLWAATTFPWRATTAHPAGTRSRRMHLQWMRPERIARTSDRTRSDKKLKDRMPHPVWERHLHKCEKEREVRMMKAEKGSEIITTICEYENSVAMPDNERLTYLDTCGIAHIKDGNGNVKAQEAYANRCSEYLRFGHEVDLAACGAYSPYDALKVCDTPEIFLKTGFEQRPMLYTQKHLFQALTPKSDYNLHRHGFSIEQVKRFPELLASPVVLANSPTREDVLLAILLATDAYDTPLIAGIKPDGTGNYGEREVETNMVLSVYSRQNFIRYFALLRDMDAFVFVSGRKIDALEDLSGLPLAENCSGLDIDRILQRPKCLG